MAEENPNVVEAQSYTNAMLVKALRAIATWSVPVEDGLGRAVLNEAAERLAAHYSDSPSTGERPNE